VGGASSWARTGRGGIWERRRKRERRREKRLLCCPYIGTLPPVEVMMEFEQLKDKILTLFREDQLSSADAIGRTGVRSLGWEEILRRLDRHEEELSRLGRMRQDMGAQEA
jgi:hypothetical protein